VAAKVTLDTNIYVSAFQFGGMRLLHMAVNGDISIGMAIGSMMPGSRFWGLPGSPRRHKPWTS
jgi:hypothetical protein